MSRRVIALNVLIGLVVVGLGVLLAREMAVRRSLPPASARPAAPGSPAGEQAAPAAPGRGGDSIGAYGVIASRNLFTATRTEAPPAPASPARHRPRPRSPSSMASSWTKPRVERGSKIRRPSGRMATRSATRLEGAASSGSPPTGWSSPGPRARSRCCSGIRRSHGRQARPRARRRRQDPRRGPTPPGVVPGGAVPLPARLRPRTVRRPCAPAGTGGTPPPAPPQPTRRPAVGDSAGPDR